MMKRLFAILLAALMLFALAPFAAAEETPRDAHYLEINEQTFPDEHFRLFIREHYGMFDADDDAGEEDRVWYLTKEKVLSVKEMEIDCHVSDFTGLEHFTELTVLTVDPYGTTAVNLSFSKNTKLRSLTLRNFNVNAIDLSPLKELTYLNVESVPLRSLDLSQNTKLADLILDNVPLTALDVTGCADLHTLSLMDVPIPALDVTNCKLLKELFIMGGSVAALDVTNCTYLRNLALFYLPITALDLTNCTKLESLQLEACPIPSLDLSHCEKLIKAIYENDDPDAPRVLHSLNLGNKPALIDLFFNSTDLTEIDLSQCPNLSHLEIGGRLTVLDLSQCPKLCNVYCPNNQLSSLILNPASPLYLLWCGGNRLSELDLSKYNTLRNCEPGTQTVTAIGGFTPSGDAYTFDMHVLVTDTSRVSFPDAAFSYDPATGIVTAQETVDAFTYLYNTGKAQMQVNVTFTAAFGGEATAAFSEGAVHYKGETPYVIANGSAQKPAVTVTDESGNAVDPAYYTVTYADNVDPGTGTATVAFRGTDRTLSLWFKIYLPATVTTAVQNVENGIRVSWEPVPGAKGYVIYRRAWNLQSNGWTEFKRWNNTTAATWTDTAVYAGTRYQYGVKAYFDDPMDNFNLGIVGPLKTTVRITTRRLLGVDAGKQQMTVRWSGSKYCTGYQIKYSTDPNFKKDVTAYKVTRPDTYRNTVKDLASGTTYYVTIRSYTVFGGMTYFGEWSNVLSTKIR